MSILSSTKAGISNVALTPSYLTKNGYRRCKGKKSIYRFDKIHYLNYMSWGEKFFVNLTISWEDRPREYFGMMSKENVANHASRAIAVDNIGDLHAIQKIWREKNMRKKNALTKAYWKRKEKEKKEKEKSASRRY